jgi:hypothetical protein
MRRMVGARPTNHGLVMTYVAAPASEFPDWHGFAVDNGEARGLVLDSFERAFVRALSHSGERSARPKPT